MVVLTLVDFERDNLNPVAILWRIFKIRIRMAMSQEESLRKFNGQIYLYYSSNKFYFLGVSPLPLRADLCPATGKRQLLWAWSIMT